MDGCEGNTESLSSNTEILQCNTESLESNTESLEHIAKIRATLRFLVWATFNPAKAARDTLNNIQNNGNR